MVENKRKDKPAAYRRERSKHLDRRLRHLHRRLSHIEQELRLLEDGRFYRVCIFGSARIKPETKMYNDVVELASQLAGRGVDILSGGGPGLMEAANLGAKLGKKREGSASRSFGLSIELDFEPTPNSHLDVKRHHHKFSSRLDDFMRLSHSIVVTPGGIGTLLELFFSWQLIQVKHMTKRPVVLLDSSYWDGIVRWMREVPLARGLVSAHDFDCLSVVDTPEDAARLILDHYEQSQANNGTGAEGETRAAEEDSHDYEVGEYPAEATIAVANYEDDDDEDDEESDDDE